MNRITKYCLLLSVLLLSCQLPAQDADSLEAGNQPNKGFSVDYADDDERSLGEVEAVSISRQPDDDRFMICVVRDGQTIYDIAKKYSVDVRDIKASNDSLTNDVQAGQMIKIYSRYRTKSPFISHYVEYEMKTSDLIALWGITEDEFKSMNPVVGKKVKEGQYVYIPLSRNDEPYEETVEENIETIEFKVDCQCEKEFGNEQYRVALLIPLYLDQIDSTFVGLAPDKSMLRTRQFQFMHFYEGFMLAIDSLVSTYGLNVIVDVYDVGQSVDKTRLFLADSLLEDADLIVGPFYSKSFSLVSDYAKSHDKLIVNPLSTRDNVIFGNPNVVKVKPSYQAQYAQLVEFIKEEYPDCKISVYQMNSDVGAAEADTLVKLLSAALPEKAGFTRQEFRSLYEKRKKHSKIPLSTLTIEGRPLVIDSVLHGPDTVYIGNQVSKFNYLIDSINGFKNSGASVFRNNLVIACGDDVVFATEMLNKLNIVADTFDITLVGLPEWGNFNQLFIENLLRINTVCFGNKYINYDDFAIKMFIQSFRNKYHFEPEEIAYDGFDIAWYFMKAFMRYGHSLNKCLSEYRIPLLGSQYNFDRFDVNDGQSNGYWHIYQYSDYDRVLRR